MLDFVGITDHDYVLGRRMQEFQWSQLRSACAAFNQDGRFITFSGYEWTSPDWGHICVHYADDEQPIFYHCDDSASSPDKLLRRLNPEVAFVHYPHPMSIRVDWWNWNSKLLVGAEVVGYNNYIFEYYGCPGGPSYTVANSSVQDIIAAGYKIGLLGSGDGHEGKPGQGGLTAVYADSLTRESIRRALLARRFYATTGVRILLKFSIDGHSMGEIYDTIATARPCLNFEVHSPSKIAAVEIVKNNRILRTYAVNDTTYNRSEIDTMYSGNACYYLRVILMNNHKAWSSPVWVRSSNTPPDSFSVLTPKWSQASSVIWRNPENIITWTKPRDADFGDIMSYLVEWKEDANEGSTIFVSDTIFGTTYHFTELLKNKTKYNMRVVAEDGRGGRCYARPGWFNVLVDYWDRNVAQDFGFLTLTPNPFSKAVAVDFFSKKKQNLTLSFYNALGQEVWSKGIVFAGQGVATIWWRPQSSGRSLPAGIYFVSLSDGRDRVTRKIVMLR